MIEAAIQGHSHTNGPVMIDIKDYGLSLVPPREAGLYPEFPLSRTILIERPWIQSVRSKRCLIPKEAVPETAFQIADIPQALRLGFAPVRGLDYHSPHWRTPCSVSGRRRASRWAM